MAQDPSGTLLCLKQSQYKRHGLPEVNSAEAQAICSLIQPLLPDVEDVHDLRERLRTTYNLGHAINSVVLRMALRQYRDLLPELSNPILQRRPMPKHQLRATSNDHFLSITLARSVK